MGATIVGYLAAYVFLSLYRRRRGRERAHSALLLEVDRCSADLARRMLPSLAVEKHRFSDLRPGNQAMSLEFDGLRLHLSTGQALLEGVTGRFEAGRMVAVMGPSGAGKTSFLNVLSDRPGRGTPGGVVRVDGKECSASQIRHAVGFVPQDDVVHEHLTVREQVYYSARLRNPTGTPAQKIDRIVEDVLCILGLTSVQDSFVGTTERRVLSGGQRKRVNISLELAACPRILFLDEPTSGLDATSALGVVQSLKRLADLGMALVMSIHQPRFSLYKLFDEVLLLGGGGRTVFLGPAQGAVAYFQGLGFPMADLENPADWMMDVISGIVPCEGTSAVKAEALPDVWKAHSATWQADFGWAEPRSAAKCVVVPGLSVLDKEWDGFGASSNGVLSQAELAALLEEFSGSPPAKAVVHELVARISGGKEADGVTKGQVASFLLGMQSSWVRAAAAHHDVEDPLAGESAAHVARRPGCLAQYAILLHRDLLCWLRRTRQRASAAALVLLAGGIFGTKSEHKLSVDQALMPSIVNTSLMAMGLLVGLFSLNVFGRDRAVCWRESARGVSVGAMFTSRVAVNLLDVLMLPLLYTAMWWALAHSPDSFWLYYPACLATAVVASCWGYLISALVPPHCSTMVITVVMLVFGAALGDPHSLAESRESFMLNAARASAFAMGTADVYLRAVDMHGGLGAVPLPMQTVHAGYQALVSGIPGACSAMLGFAAVLTFAGYVALRVSTRGRQL